MRTIIISTKEHIDAINRYKLFFEPLLGRETAFCEWNPTGSTIDEIVPDIYRCIDGARRWRVIILSNPSEESQRRCNPFDVVSFPKDASVKQKMEAYDTASEQPLAKLATFLCPLPMKVNSENNSNVDTTEKADSDKEPVSYYTSDPVQQRQKRESDNEIAFNAYRQLASYKASLRENILSSGELKAMQPESVICLSLRTVRTGAEEDEDGVELAWKASTSVNYTDFCDSNMYFDRMRFLVYDIYPEGHANYKFAYLQFIYTLLVFAGTNMPSDAARPYRLYRLSSDCDEEGLKALIGDYDHKLENTVVRIGREIEELNKDFPQPMTDNEAERIFQTPTVISVLLDKQFDMEGYYPDSKVFGLADQCPADERSVWSDMAHKSADVMHKLVKQPRRSLDKSIGSFRAANREETNKILALNRFQIEDIQEFVDVEEEKMVGVTTNDFYDTRRYDESLEKNRAAVNKVLETRMKKKTTVILGVIALAAFFVGFLPTIFMNRNVLNVPIPLLITVFSLALLAAVGVVRLIFLRKEVRDAVDVYNENMASIKNDVDTSMDRFSEFLSSACRVMRGNYVLNVTRENDNVFKQKTRILKGHIGIIREHQSHLRELFGEYSLEHRVDPDIPPYEYNFEIARIDYPYPVPFKKEAKDIPFLQDDSRVSVPFVFINEISLTMEELYE